MRVVAFWAALLMFTGCPGITAAPETTMNPTPTIQYTQGPPLQPAEALVSWLQGAASPGQDPKPFIRLPVVIRFEDSLKLGIHEAWIGGSDAEIGEGSVALRLDDTGMSVGVLDHILDRIPAEDVHCVVWLEGTWGPLVDLPMPQIPGEPPDTRDVFAVRRVGEMVTPGQGTHAHIEAGNP